MILSATYITTPTEESHMDIYVMNQKKEFFLRPSMKNIAFCSRKIYIERKKDVSMTFGV